MATLDQVAKIALKQDGVIELDRRGSRTWSVNGKVFAWERTFSKADIKRFGNGVPPDGPILAVRVADLHDKEALLAAGAPGLFTIPHFDGYAAVLIDLPKVPMKTLRELLTDGWRWAR